MRTLQSIRLTDTEANICNLLLEVAHDLNASKPNSNISLRIAGGWVRDKLLGLECGDVDIALDNILGLEFAQAVNQHMQRNGLATHNIAKIESNPERSKHLETATTKVFGQAIDFVNLRTETYDEDSRIPEVGFGTAEEDAFRRDITINSLFFNLHTKEVEDFTGKGVSDLIAGRVRTPLPPLKTFIDDPLRILRVIRFASRFGFSMDQEIISVCQDPKLREAFSTKISRERVGVEVEKMLKDPNAISSLRMINEIGFFDLIFSLPPDCSNTAICLAQCEFAWKASLAMDFILSRYDDRISMDGVPLAADDRKILYLAACLLPFRKETYQEKKHVYPASKYVIMKSLKLSSNDADVVSGLLLALPITFANFPGGSDCPRLRLGLYLRELSLSQRYMYARPLGSKWPLLLRLSLAFELASALSLADIQRLEKISDLTTNLVQRHEVFRDDIIYHQLQNVHDLKPLLNGSEVAKLLGIKPGPEVGQYLTEVIKMQLRDPSIEKEACAFALRI
ncbi:hypothetical protein HDU67_003024 [Dinochytrium kinnereticum]|nr:hypothetical protein HDU67_003024 [Dinochytrium kinnereticum]